QRIRITALTRQKQRAEFFQVVLSQVITSVVFALDGAKRGGRGKEDADLVLRDHAPERAGIGCADGLAFVKYGRVSVCQRSINNVKVPDGPAEIGSRPKDLARLDTINILHGPLERDEMSAVITHDAFRNSSRARRVQDVQRIGGG